MSKRWPKGQRVHHVGMYSDLTRMPSDKLSRIFEVGEKGPFEITQIYADRLQNKLFIMIHQLNEGHYCIEYRKMDTFTRSCLIELWKVT